MVPKNQAEANHDQGIDDRPVGQVDHDAQPQHHEGKIFRRSELEGKIGQGRCEEDEKKDGDGSCNEGAKGCDSESRSSPSLARHLVTVKTGHHRSSLSGDVDEDGGRGSSIHGPVRNPRQ